MIELERGDFVVVGAHSVWGGRFGRVCTILQENRDPADTMLIVELISGYNARERVHYSFARRELRKLSLLELLVLDENKLPTLQDAARAITPRTSSSNSA